MHSALNKDSVQIDLSVYVTNAVFLQMYWVPIRSLLGVAFLHVPTVSTLVILNL